MKRIAASALWLTYYVVINPISWTGYWIIELSNWLDAKFGVWDDKVTPIERLIFRVSQFGGALEFHSLEWWHNKMAKVGYAADLLVTFPIRDDDFPMMRSHQMTRAPWKKPFLRTHYSVQFPTPLDPDNYLKESKDIIKRIEKQFV